MGQKCSGTYAHIWAMGIHVLVITQPFLGQLAEFFVETQETIICRERMLSYLFFDFDFYAGFGGNMGVVAIKGLGPQTPTEKLAQWVDLL